MKRTVLFGILSLILRCSPLMGQAPTIRSILNAGSLDLRFCPGSVANVSGDNFGESASSVKVLVNGKPAYLTTIGVPVLLGFQIPFDTAIGTATVQVQTATGSTPLATITISQYAPTLIPLGDGSGEIYHLDPSSEFVSNVRPALPGQPVSALAYGLGPTNPPWTEGIAPAPLSATVAPVTLSVGGENVPVFFAGPSEQFRQGLYDVKFNVPSDLPSGNYPVVITVGGQVSNTVKMLLFQALPTIASVDNAASFLPKGTAAAGSILTIKGAGFGTTDKLGAYPSTQVNGISVTIGGLRAPIFDLIASKGQINVLAPFELPLTGTVPVVVTNSNGASLSFSLRLGFAVPAMFRIVDPSNTSRQNAAAVEANSAWITMPSSMASAIGLPAICTGLNPASFCGQPAKPGDYIQIYTTGLGAATVGGAPGGPSLSTGGVAPADGSKIYTAVFQPSVTIAGVAAEVVFAGMVPGYAGLYQINARIPPTVPDGDDIPIAISTLGSPGDGATIAIKH